MLVAATRSRRGTAFAFMSRVGGKAGDDGAVRNMSSRSNERFVADGHSRWWTSAEGEQVRLQIEAEVRSRYRAELERAGWFKERLLERRVRREVAAECAKVLWARR